ncbi:horma domain-containing [Pyrenophora seminiperda CCB06]|uniref:Horma domain-containing n=1 Tax=Pyrenophora seminiperda CCB06 TaxID=1302712 RepID=A0A3M7M3J2_9PLEO|nr:horma domain-containing [Pyrenophora seminiperda CCB06]
MAPTYLDTLSHFTTFLTAYTHTLLYLRTLYPRTSFVHTRFNNAPVYQSRHPLVCEWIADAVAAVHEELLNGSVAKLAIVIFSYEAGGNGAMGSAKIMERYMFDVSAFPVVDKSDRNMQIAWEGEATPEASDNDEHGQAEETGKTKALDAHVPVDLSEQFRAALLALATRTSVLAPLPPSCSFNISMELKDEGHFDPPIGHAHGWIPVQPSLQKTGREAAIRNEEEKEVVAPGQRRDKEGVDLGGVRVTPIRSVEASVLRFETWIEEGTAKFQTRERGSTKTSSTSSTG